MATNLFNKYYSDPKKQYIYTNMHCKNLTGDTNFSISGDAATINDNNRELASLDLSSIKEYIDDWRNETRIIEPQQIEYFEGFTKGNSYQKNVFVQIPDEVLQDEDYLYNSNLKFSLKYFLNGCSKSTDIDASGVLTEETTFIENAQEILTNNNIPITIDTSNGEISLTSNLDGYDFYVFYDSSSNLMKFTYNDTSTYMLEDSPSQFISPQKYRNGAFRGIVIKPTYPIFENDEISDASLSLEIVHLRNRIETYTKDASGKYDRIVKDVVAKYNEIEEIENFNKWRTHIYGTPEDYSCGTENDTSTAKNIIGLYGYLNWVQTNNLWTKFGPLYAIICPKDSPDEKYRNLIDSFVIYNPNSYPIKVSCLLMA